ncbi:MAG: DoxX family protein [Thermoflexibacteraceae bacterium]
MMMKTIKVVSLYLLVLFYVGMGAMHLLYPKQYLAMMPTWMPAHIFLIYFSGIVEIVLGLLLLPLKTRVLSAKLIIAMLIVYFFGIHIPQSIDFYQTKNEGFVASIIRLPFQFLLIAWAWIFTQKVTNH